MSNTLQSKIEEIIEKVVKGELELHEIDEFLEGNAAVVARRLALEKICKVNLSSIGTTIIDYTEVKNRNIENMIGATQIPLGVAGPLKVNGEYAKGEFYIPLATTEGALVASINRGCKAVRESGGVTTKIFYDGMTRAPVFKLPSILDVDRFLKWINENYVNIKNITESTSSHIKLKNIEYHVLGNNVWLRFVFETGDAMGMNMVTFAVEEACKYIELNFPEATCLAVSGNLCSDKKQSMINVLHGRGKTVVAEALIPHEIVKRVLKSDSELIHEVNLRKNWLGGARAGTVFQYNAHFANIITAIFLATGQDVAQAIESSMGYTWTEVRPNGLYVSITLPSLEIGTVGGGTRLPTQREALSLLGVVDHSKPVGFNSKKFAEIVAAAVLAGELNLLAALANRELGKAHKKFGRGIKV
jgi:hydroxymethylglutaryl-CoA reductase (NADPH)